MVSPDALKSLAVGNKDSGTSLNEAWNHLFIPMAAKQRRKQVGIDNGRYVDRLAFMVQSCGEYDRLAQGCFEHYPNLKPLDASFANICKNHDWLSYYDRLSGRVSERMEFELLAYVPYAIVPWYSHFAAPANATRRAEWPKADYEVRNNVLPHFGTRRETSSVVCGGPEADISRSRTRRVWPTRKLPRV